MFTRRMCRRIAFSFLRRGLVGSVAAAIAMASALSTWAAEAAGVRIALLLSAGARAAVVVDVAADGDSWHATLLPTSDRRIVTVEIGPVHRAVANQLLEAPEQTALVRDVRIRGVSQGARGTLLILQVQAKQEVAGRVRRAGRRLYIDLEPRTGAALARADSASSRGTSGSTLAPPPTPATPSSPTAAGGRDDRPAPADRSGRVLLTESLQPAADLASVLLPRPPAPPPLAVPRALLPSRGSLAGSAFSAPAPASSRTSADALRPMPARRPASAASDGRLAWPAPPAHARIRFVRALSPDAVRGRPSVLSRFFSLLTGGRTEPVMSRPYGVAVGPDRRVFVADAANGLIHIYNVEKSAYSTLRVNAQSLIGVALLGDHVVVTDSESGRVICLDHRGREQWTLGRAQGFERPTGIAASRDRLYVVDTMKHRVVTVSASGTVLGTFGTRGPGPGEFNFPTNVARGSDGRLFVTDSMNFRVQVFDEGGRHLKTFGRLGDGTGDFNKPKGIALDSAGHVYVVEGLNDVVQIFDDSGRLLLSFGGSGNGDGQLWLPSGIAIANDFVYVADSSNRRVQMFEYLTGAE